MTLIGFSNKFAHRRNIVAAQSEKEVIRRRLRTVREADRSLHRVGQCRPPLCDNRKGVHIVAAHDRCGAIDDKRILADDIVDAGKNECLRE